MKAAARLGYQPVRRGGGAGRSAAAAIGFICDEISTDPWTAIGLDGVREKAWERGLTVMVMATRGDADMESAALAQLTAQPLVGLIYATINTRLIDAPAALPTAADGAAQLPRRQWRAALRRARAKSPAATPRPTF